MRRISEQLGYDSDRVLAHVIRASEWIRLAYVRGRLLPRGNDKPKLSFLLTASRKSRYAGLISQAYFWMSFHLVFLIRSTSSRALTSVWPFSCVESPRRAAVSHLRVIAGAEQWALPRGIEESCGQWTWPGQSRQGQVRYERRSEFSLSQGGDSRLSRIAFRHISHSQSRSVCGGSDFSLPGLAPDTLVPEAPAIAGSSVFDRVYGASSSPSDRD